MCWSSGSGSTLRIPLERKGRQWGRFEMWDIVTNGAFTRPIWLEEKK